MTFRQWKLFRGPKHLSAPVADIIVHRRDRVGRQGPSDRSRWAEVRLSDGAVWRIKALPYGFFWGIKQS